MSECNDDIYCAPERKFDEKADVKSGKTTVDIINKCCMRIIERTNTNDHWNKIVERDIALTKLKYPFLSDKQVRGKVLQKLEIPNFMGNIVRTGNNRVSGSLAKELSLWTVKKEAKVPAPFRMLRTRLPELIKKEMKQPPSTSSLSQSSTSSGFTQSTFNKNSNVNIKNEPPPYIPNVLLLKRPPSANSSESDDFIPTPRKRRQLSQDDVQMMKRDWHDAADSTLYLSQVKNQKDPNKMTRKHVTSFQSSSSDHFFSPSQTPTLMETPESARDEIVFQHTALSSPELFNHVRKNTNHEKDGILRKPIRNHGSSVNVRYMALRNLANEYESREKLMSKEGNLNTIQNSKGFENLKSVESSVNLEISQITTNLKISQNSLKIDFQSSLNFEVFQSSVHLKMPSFQLSQNYPNAELIETYQNSQIFPNVTFSKNLEKSKNSQLSINAHSKYCKNLIFIPTYNSPRISLDSQTSSSCESLVFNTASSSTGHENQASSEDPGNAIFMNILWQISQNSASDKEVPSLDILRNVPLPPTVTNPFAVINIINSPPQQDFSSPINFFSQKNLKLSDCCKNLFNENVKFNETSPEALNPVQQSFFSTKNYNSSINNLHFSISSTKFSNKNNSFLESNGNDSSMSIIALDNEKDVHDEDENALEDENSSNFSRITAVDENSDYQEAIYDSLSEFLQFSQASRFSKPQSLDSSDYSYKNDSDIDKNNSVEDISIPGSLSADYSSSESEETKIHSSQSIIFLSDEVSQPFGINENNKEANESPSIQIIIPEVAPVEKSLLQEQNLSRACSSIANRKKVSENHCNSASLNEISEYPETNGVRKGYPEIETNNTLFYSENSQIFVHQSITSSSNHHRQKMNHCFTQVVVVDVEKEDSYEPSTPLSVESRIDKENYEISIANAIQESSSPPKLLTIERSPIIEKTSQICIVTSEISQNHQNSNSEKNDFSIPVINPNNENDEEKTFEFETFKQNSSKILQNDKNGEDQNLEINKSLSATKSQVSTQYSAEVEANTSPETSRRMKVQNCTEIHSKNCENVKIICRETVTDAGYLLDSNSSEICSSQSTREGSALSTDNSQKNPWFNVTSQDFSQPLNAGSLSSQDSGIITTSDTITSLDLLLFSSSDESGSSDVESDFPSISEMVQVKCSSVKRKINDLVRQLDNESFETN